MTAIIVAIVNFKPLTVRPSSANISPNPAPCLLPAMNAASNIKTPGVFIQTNVYGAPPSPVYIGTADLNCIRNEFIGGTSLLVNSRNMKISMNGRHALIPFAAVTVVDACDGIANSGSSIGNFFAMNTIVPIVTIAPATTASSGPTNIDSASSGRKNATPEPMHIIVIPRKPFIPPPAVIVISHGHSSVKTPSWSEVNVASCTASKPVTLPNVTSGIPIEP